MIEQKIPFISHLGELRKRIITALIGLSVGFFIAFYFSESLFAALTMPLNFDIAYKATAPFIYLVEKEAAIGKLVFLAPAEAFWSHIKISMIAAIVLSFPLIMYQLWAFIAPGLLQKEKKFASPFVLVTSGLFILGALFCFIVVLPFAIGFLLTYKTAHLEPMLSVEKYIDFSLKFIIAFGVIFELPVVMVFLTRSGLVKYETFARNRKYSVLMAFVVAAFLTPTPDAFNQSLMAGPIIVLFEVGLLISRFFVKRKKTDDGDDSGQERKGRGH